MEKVIKEKIEEVVSYIKKWIIFYSILEVISILGIIYFCMLVLPFGSQIGGLVYKVGGAFLACLLAVLLIFLCAIPILVLIMLAYNASRKMKQKDENFIKLYDDESPEFFVLNTFISRKIRKTQNEIRSQYEIEAKRYSKDLFGLLKESNNNDESLRKGKIEKEEYEEVDTKLNKAIKERKKNLEDEKSSLNVKYLRGLITKEELEFEIKKIQDELDGFERLKD